jgi:hypothetical protein
MSEEDENLRLVFQLTHDRNERIISYVRVTDGAIWGFLGLVIIQFFKESVDLNSPNVPFFCVLLTFSMFLWRYRVAIYQKDVVKGHNRMLRCEKLLDIPFEVTIRKNYCDSINKNCFINPKPETFSDLINLIDPDKYKDPRHVFMDRLAIFLGIFGIFSLILWVYFNFQRYFSVNSYDLNIVLFVLVLFWILVSSIWVYQWRSLIFNFCKS